VPSSSSVTTMQTNMRIEQTTQLGDPRRSSMPDASPTSETLIVPCQALCLAAHAIR
jgi:hypothetical protein